MQTDHFFRLGYSKKGYTDGEIGRAWIEQFDKETQAKANGRRRLLLVDGHVSHYTRGFLQYAREHNIEVIAYPSHSTHVYQGLDVVIFSPLKKNWTRARDQWERDGHTVDKTNFLRVYAEAHKQTLTEANIKAAFRKTGVIPFNPDVVTADMMAPSETTSISALASIRQTTPVRFITDMVRDYIDHQAILEEKEREDMDVDSDSNTSDDDMNNTNKDNEPSPSIPLFMRRSIDSLHSTPARFLVSRSPITSASKPPSFRPYRISPKKPMSRYKALLDTPTSTEHEQKLRDALLESEARDESRKESMIGMQAGVILANMYSSQVNKQLQAKEEKQRNKGKKRLMGDGKAKLFTGDEFYTLVVEDERQREEVANNANERRDARLAHAERVSEWKRENEAIKERNEVKKKQLVEAVARWEAEKELAKAQKRKPGWIKPKWRDFNPEKLKPRPKKDGGDDDDDGEDDDGDDEDS